MWCIWFPFPGSLYVFFLSIFRVFCHARATLVFTCLFLFSLNKTNIIMNTNYNYSLSQLQLKSQSPYPMTITSCTFGNLHHPRPKPEECPHSDPKHNRTDLCLCHLPDTVPQTRMLVPTPLIISTTTSQMASNTKRQFHPPPSLPFSFPSFASEIHSVQQSLATIPLAATGAEIAL